MTIGWLFFRVVKNNKGNVVLFYWCIAMGIGDGIFNRVQSDLAYKAGSGISHGVSSGVGGLLKKATDKKPVCPKCKNPLPSPLGKFCAKCGAALAIKCPKCSSEYAVGTGFCAQCGTKLA